MQALIVGAGAVGRWFADVIGDSFEVTMYDRDPDVAAAAVEASDATMTTTFEDRRYELVCTAVPLLATETAIGDHAHRATTAVLDLSGSMQAPGAAMRRHADGLERINLHPLFAPDHAPGRVATSIEDGEEVATTIERSIEAAGCTIVETTPERHDRAMKTVQANVHAAVIAYALAADPIPSEFDTPVSAALRDLAVTVLDGNPRVYADIQQCFGSDAVAEAAREVATADQQTFAELYRTAAANLEGRERDP